MIPVTVFAVPCKMNGRNPVRYMMYPWFEEHTDGHDQNEILEICLEELHGKAELFLEKKSGFSGMDKETLEENQAIAMYVYELFPKDTVIRILLQPFSSRCVTEGGFQFGKERMIFCPVLKRFGLKNADLVSGYLYTFHAPEISESFEKSSLLEQYYLENWMISFLDAGREYARDYLFRKHNVRTSHYVTDSFGPGYYGMPIEATRQLFEVMDGASVGVRLDHESGNMIPMKSCVGIYLVLTKDVSRLMGYDCTNCAGSRLGCSACKNY